MLACAVLLLLPDAHMLMLRGKVICSRHEIFQASVTKNALIP
jgi:hypothetical protein